MSRIIYISFFIIILGKYSNAETKVIYEELFSIPEKGTWGDNENQTVNSNLFGIDWKLNVEKCRFETSSDYVKTVPTSGGRLEALDCNGEAVFYSPWISSVDFQNINVDIGVGETGSGRNADNKYIKFAYRTKEGEEYSFPGSSVVEGDFGTRNLEFVIDHADSLQIIIRLNNHYAGDKIYVSSILVSGENLVPGKDQDAQVIPHGEQILSRNISPIDSAISVLKFQVIDVGTSDALPVKIEKMQLLAEAKFRDEIIHAPVERLQFFVEDRLIELDSITKEGDYFNVWPKEEALQINNGSMVELTCKAVLEKNGLKDGTALHFIVDNNKHGWVADTSGTQFAAVFEEDTYSEEFKISIEAEEFKVIESPKIVAQDKPFSIQGELVDRYGNVDLDFTGNEKLSVHKGSLSLKGVSLIKNANGLFSWEEIVANAPGKVELEIQFPGTAIPPTILQIEVVPEIKLIIDDNFENRNLTKWENADDWLIDTTNVIAGQYSLQHKSGLETGNSLISKSFARFDADMYHTNWEFSLKNGNWNPSSSNRFFFFLGDGVHNDPTYTGYSIGVNQVGSSDSLQFCFWQSGKVKNVIYTLPFLWEENTSTTIQLDRHPGGKWNISLINQELNDFKNPIQITDDQLTNFSCSGLRFDYSASRSGKLWMDEVLLRLIPAPVSIKNIESVSGNLLRISFNRGFEINSALDLLNYRLESKDGEQVLLRGIEQESETSILLETGKISSSNVVLFVEGIADVHGRLMEEQILNFQFSPPAFPGAIIFNEIMADPSPSNGLPDFEYIELYNRSGFPINLEGWSLHIDDRIKELPAFELAPDSFLIITTTGGLEEFEKLVPTVGISGLSLKNDGASLALFDTSDSLIYKLKYEKAWMNDKEKEEGGWSLECIDPNRLCGHEFNWQASTSGNGGTPGKANSVKAKNPDNTVPEFEGFRITSPTEIELHFSEPVQFIDPQIELSPEISIKSINYSEGNGEIVLELNQEIQPDVSYKLNLPNVADECGNVLEGKILELKYHKTKKGEVLINEILFNPKSGGSDYIELYNPQVFEININNLYLATRNDTFAIDEVTPIKSEKILKKGEFAVVTTDAGNIRSNYLNSCIDCFVEMEKMPNFDDKEGYIILLNDSMEIINEVAYSEELHFDLLEDKNGVALERVSYTANSMAPSTWQSAAETVGFGTPGLENSQFKEKETQEAQFYFEPNPFSPNNDGYNDRLEIHLNFNEGEVANIRIFDARGRTVRHVANNLLIGNNTTLTWDGLDNEGKKVPIGSYIILVELHDLKGNRKVFKNSVGVTGRLD